MSTRQNFEPFGNLAHIVGALWERTVGIDFLGRNWQVPMTIKVSPRSGIEENQRLAFGAYTRDTGAILLAGEEAIFDYYTKICHDYRSCAGIVNPNHELIPLVTRKQEVFRLVTLEALYFPYVRPRPTMGILCKCTWEPEHGLAVKYEEGKIVDVGTQDIVL